MIYYIIDSTGEQVSQLSVSPEDLDLNLKEGQIALLTPFPKYPAYWYNGTWQAKPDKPSIFYIWDRAQKVWVDPRTEAEKLATQWASIKAKRDSLLTGSDWRVIKAADIEVPLAENWKIYRQALRDITTQSDPFNITWPVAPTS